jgi:transposase
VDALELRALGFDGVDPAATGRPAYYPSPMLKLYIYGYLNRVQSSRRLEREAGRNLEVMWLTGRLAPDHKTIADFRKDNGAAIPERSADRVTDARPSDKAENAIKYRQNVDRVNRSRDTDIERALGGLRR